MLNQTRIALVAATMIAVACAKKVPPPEEASPAAQPATETTPPPETTQPQTELPPQSEDTTDAASARLRENMKRVHFAYNSDSLTEESKAALDENVRILNDYRSIEIEVQGHADSRGTTEYNLALGERRAKAVLTYLTRSGVAASRIDVISYGEESPLVDGAGEEAWAQNRRVEVAVTAGGATAGVRGSTEEGPSASRAPFTEESVEESEEEEDVTLSPRAEAETEDEE